MTKSEALSTLEIKITKSNPISEIFLIIVTEQIGRTFREVSVENEHGFSELFIKERFQPGDFGLTLDILKDIETSKLRPGDIFFHSSSSIFKKGKFSFGIVGNDTAPTDCKCYVFAKLLNLDGFTISPDDKVIDCKVVVSLH